MPSRKGLRVMGNAGFQEHNRPIVGLYQGDWEEDVQMFYPLQPDPCFDAQLILLMCYV